MSSRTVQTLLARLKCWLFRQDAVLTDLDRARQLVAAVDRGGIPLNPARINAIARGLGLEVSRSAAPEQTIARIRAAVERAT
jgi:hypothetical protein